MAYINSCTYVNGTGTATTLPFGLWLSNCYSGNLCSEKWLDKAVPDKMSRRNSGGKKEKFHEYNPIHVLQTVLLSLLLAHGQAQVRVSLSISQE